MRHEFMDTMRLKPQFSASSSWGDAGCASFTGFLDLCRKGDVEAIIKDIPHIKQEHLSAGLTTAIQHGQDATVALLAKHVKPRKTDMEEAIKTNSHAILNAIDPMGKLAREHGYGLLALTISDDADVSVHYLLENGVALNTKVRGDLYLAGMCQKDKVFEAMLQHVTFIDPLCSEELTQANKVYPHIKELLTSRKNKEDLLQTLTTYQHYQIHRGTTPARPSNKKIRDFTVDTVAGMINRKKPLLTQNALDDFHTQKYARKSSEQAPSTRTKNPHPLLRRSICPT